MTPTARIQAAIEILAALETTAKPADRFLRDWFRARRYAGSKDRAAIAERVFFILRHRASFTWRMNSEEPRALAIASLLQEGVGVDEVELLFGGEGHGPAPLHEHERHAIAVLSRGERPLHVRGEFPAWLQPELQRAFGDNLLVEMEAFATRASIDLRVNTLKTSRADVLARLKADGYAVEPTPFAPHGLRLASGGGASALNRHPLFLAGAFEFQDEAAQIASHLCTAKPGDRVLDLAAGAGGKSLALAADMKNEGEIVACDIRAEALDELRARATRAGATIIRPHLGEPPPGEFDIVVVDAPCSGSGTWRRQPELKWRLTPERLSELHRVQDALLEQAFLCLAEIGDIVYITCSFLPSENEDRTAAFLARHSGFGQKPLDQSWTLSFGTCAPPGVDHFFRATPHRTGTDGFFAAKFGRPVGA